MAATKTDIAQKTVDMDSKAVETASTTEELAQKTADSATPEAKTDAATKVVDAQAP
ncbi:hypothetical protein [Lacticaseibacillus manihotivorans]|uniref:hypothetical protein n=1 Tax=Lacticaseibacillus manihotivorans TaxID=88233 RepID=UPI001FB53169|nr:hypothetical protein [Lacticaseibacillus manihotivorans]